MSKKIVLGIFRVLATLFTIFILYMVFIVKASFHNAAKNNSVEISGIVNEIYEGGVKDLVLKFENNDNIYYINRGLENNFELDQVENDLMNRNITLWYSKNRNNKVFHIMQLMVKDSLFYSEWKDPLTSKNTSL